MPISEDLKKIVVCPKCRTPLVYNEIKEGFDCSACKLRYPVEDGIANLIYEAAKEIEADE